MWIRTNTAVLALILNLPIAVITRAGETPQPKTNSDGVTDDQIAKLINALGNDSYEERQKAEEGLRQAGSRAKAALDLAAQSKDPEMKLRAARLLNVLQRESAHTTLDLGGGIKLGLMLIPAGKFKMGSPVGERYHGGDETEHEVTISRAFYMGKFVVTQEQYEKVMGANPSQCKGAQQPVDQIRWDDAQAFCNKLGAATGKTLRLPTEAEWEYACRAGTTTAFSFGDSAESLDEYAWYDANSGGVSHPVGQKKPNPWGLYDMHGNSWVWCSDWYDSDYQLTDKVDPKGPASGSFHVIRGGSWMNGLSHCRSASRWGDNFGETSPDVGFRVVMEVPPDAKDEKK